MGPNHIEASGVDQFLAGLRERETPYHYRQHHRPMLYLKCWGSDYPYLQATEQQKRWLPAVVSSPITL